MSRKLQNMNSLQKYIVNQNSSQNGNSLGYHVTYATLSAPHKTYKMGSTEIINHFTVYEYVNLKVVSNFPKGMQEAFGRFGHVIQIQ